jgi:hypothetical protein
MLINSEEIDATDKKLYILEIKEVSEGEVKNRKRGGA